MAEDDAATREVEGSLGVDGAAKRPPGRLHRDRLAPEVEIPVPRAAIETVGHQYRVPLCCRVDAGLDGWLVAGNVDHRGGGCGDETEQQQQCHGTDFHITYSMKGGGRSRSRRPKVLRLLRDQYDSEQRLTGNRLPHTYRLAVFFCGVKIYRQHRVSPWPCTAPAQLECNQRSGARCCQTRPFSRARCRPSEDTVLENAEARCAFFAP